MKYEKACTCIIKKQVNTYLLSLYITQSFNLTMYSATQYQANINILLSMFLYKDSIIPVRMDHIEESVSNIILSCICNSRNICSQEAVWPMALVMKYIQRRISLGGNQKIYTYKVYIKIHRHGDELLIYYKYIKTHCFFGGH